MRVEMLSVLVHHRGSMASAATNVGDDERIVIRPYAGEKEIEAVMGLIDGELSEPYTIYTYRYFLNQWPELCFLAYQSATLSPTSSSLSQTPPPLQQQQQERPIGVVIGKLDRHMKGDRFMRGYIGMVSVEPAFRGRGIAKRLLHVTLSEMVKRGAQEIVLETEIDNVASLRLYESFGFVREKRLFNFYLNGKDCFRLILQLPPCVWQQFLSSLQQQQQQQTGGHHNWAAQQASSRYVGPEQNSPPRPELLLNRDAIM